MAGMLLLECVVALALRGRAGAADGEQVEKWVRGWGGEPDTAFYASRMDLCAKVSAAVGSVA